MHDQVAQAKVAEVREEALAAVAPTAVDVDLFGKDVAVRENAEGVVRELESRRQRADA
jgi:hypothetical protein